MEEFIERLKSNAEYHENNGNQTTAELLCQAINVIEVQQQKLKERS